MKSFLVLSAIVMSSQAMSAEVLLKYTRGSGFSPRPMSTTLEVKDNGEVVSVRRSQTTAEKTVVAKLTASTVQVIKDRIEMITDDAVLVDLDAKKPRCTDAPSSRITINKGGKEIEIAGTSSCHRFEVQQSAATELAKVVNSFVYITK